MGKIKTIQSIDRAISVLKIFSERRKEMKLSDITDELDLNKSTAHGIITTLKYHGLIDQNEETQQYRLGLYLMRLGDLVANSIDVIDIAHPIIERVSETLDETVHMSKLDEDEIIYLDKVESNQSMRIFTSVGSRMPAHCTGMGKVLLSYYDERKIDKILPDTLEKMAANTITDKAEVLKELKCIREKGYAIDDGESDNGLRCVAAPIFNHLGETKFAVSVTDPAIRLTENRLDSIVETVKNAAREISYRLGYIE